jgi:hypothetical protein
VLLNTGSRDRTDNLITANLAAAAPLGQDLGSEGYSGTARVRLERLDTQAVGYFRAGFSLSGGYNGDASLQGQLVRRVWQIGIAELDPDSPGYLAFPDAGTAVAVTVEAEQTASPEAPLLIGDVHPVTLWRHLLEGKFGYLWAPPETLPPGRAYGDARLPIAYDAAAFAALEADDRFPPLRFVITESAPRGDWIQEHILRAANLAYYLDGEGVVQPVDLRTPASVAGLATITDADLRVGAPKTWAFDRGKAITRVAITYYEDTIAEPGAHGEGVYRGLIWLPGMQQAGFEELAHTEEIGDLGSTDLGDELFTLDVKGFRTMDADTLGAQSRAQYLRAALIAIAHETARPFGHATAELPLSCVRGGNGDALPGALRLLQVRSVPDPATKQLGGTRLVRITDRQERKGFVDLTVMDLGAPTVALVPTIGAPAQESGNEQFGVTVDVTLNAAGEPVELQYAITPDTEGSAPAEGSVLWTWALFSPNNLGLIRSSGAVSFRGLPAGQRIWVRGRTFPRLNFVLPSAWVAAAAPGYVDLDPLDAPSGLTLTPTPASALGGDVVFLASWTNGAADLGIELLIASPTSDPRVVVARLPPGSTQYPFPGDTGLVLETETEYRVGVRHYTTAPDSVSAEDTEDITTPSDFGLVWPDGPLIHRPFLGGGVV